MKRLSSYLRVGAVLAIVHAAAGCGGSAPLSPESADGKAADSAQPSKAAGGLDVSGAEKDPEEEFDSSEKQLEALFDLGGGDLPADPGTDPATPDLDENDATGLQGQDRCTVACKALASMRRSADRVCQIAGEADSRCESLRKRVDRAKSVVYTKCPACEAARE